MSRNTLPLSARHLYPSIGPPFVGIHRFSGRIGARGFKDARRYGPIAKYRYFYIFLVLLCHKRRVQQIDSNEAV